MTNARITNLTRGTLLASHALVPETAQERRTGLLNHDALMPGEGLLLLDCNSIHTYRMKFLIDVCFCDGRGFVKSARAFLDCGRRQSLNGARFVVELPAGMLHETGTVFGDQLGIEFL